jgi:hypothetical protein
MAAFTNRTATTTRSANRTAVQRSGARRSRPRQRQAASIAANTKPDAEREPDHAVLGDARGNEQSRNSAAKTASVTGPLP